MLNRTNLGSFMIMPDTNDPVLQLLLLSTVVLRELTRRIVKILFFPKKAKIYDFNLTRFQTSGICIYMVANNLDRSLCHSILFLSIVVVRE